MKTREKITVQNIKTYYKLSWDFVITKKWTSKVYFFFYLPRAFYLLFIKGV